MRSLWYVVLGFNAVAVWACSSSSSSSSNSVAIDANEQGTTYTGTCGSSYQTHASPHDICWCN